MLLREKGCSIKLNWLLFTLTLKEDHQFKPKLSLTHYNISPIEHCLKLKSLILFRAPIYCFAGHEVLNSANIILTTGNKVYASKH